jgi:hypothetical protein
MQVRPVHSWRGKDPSMNVQGNELADKEAAIGTGRNSPPGLPKYLLQSAPALKALQKTRFRTLSSPRYTRTMNVDPSMPSGKYMELVNGLSKRVSSLYIQMRTRHIPLNSHLQRISKSDTPCRPICPGIDETISIALGRNATSISYILTSDNATSHRHMSIARADLNQILVSCKNV